MIPIEGTFLSIFLARGMMQLVIIGILITELFNHGRKNKFEVFWLLSIALLWSLFLGISDYGIFTGGLHVSGVLVALTSFVFALGLFIAIIIKRFKLVNKVLAFPTAILASAMLIIALIDRYNFFPAIMLPMSVSSFIVTLLGAFVIIDLLIKTSKGYRARPKKKISSIFWKVLGIIVLAVVIISLFFLSFTGRVALAPTEQQLSSELNVYNWQDYIGSDTIENFEKEFGVKVNLEYFSSNHEMIEGIKENPEKYDVAMASERLINDVKEQGLISPIDRKNIPNLKNVDEGFLNAEYNSDDLWGVPYMWGTTGLVIDTKYIPEDTDSWGVLWDIRNKGKIAILNDKDLVLGLASMYVGNPIYPQTVSHFNQARDFILLQKPLLTGYKSSVSIKKALISEELWAAQAYGGDAFIAAKENPSIKYIIPKEGAQKWVDNLIIPKGSRNKYTAEVFINYIMDAKVNAEISNEIHYLTTNKAARKFLDEKLNLLYPSQEEDLRLEYFSDYNKSEEIKALNDDLWEELIK